VLELPGQAILRILLVVPEVSDVQVNDSPILIPKVPEEVADEFQVDRNPRYP
jgi:hypothetical protein